MIKGNIMIHGIHGQKANKLKELNIFERIIDVYLSGAMVGLLYNREEEEDKSMKTKAVSIFAETLQGEASRLKYFASLAFLVQNSSMKGDEVKERELLRQAFGDWFGVSDGDGQKKYDLLHRFALAGIDILYDNIVKDSTDTESYYRNYYNLLGELEGLSIDNEVDRSIVGALL